MTVSLKHNKVSAVPDGGDSSLVLPSDWNAEHVLTQATGTLLGRTTAGAGATEEISPSSELTLSSGTLGVAASIGGKTLTGPSVIEVNSGSGTNALRITQTGAGNALLVEDAANPDATPFVVDASGRVFIGSTGSAGQTSTALLPNTQVIGTGTTAGNANAASSLGIYRFFDDTTGPAQLFFKSRSSAPGAFTTVASGDALGSILFQADDGTSFPRAAAISAAVDGTPGLNDMPGRLVFSTTADGASTPTERMRIDSTGDVGIGTTNPTARLNVVDATSQDAVRITQTGSGNALVVEDAANPDGTPFVVDADGRFIHGHTSALTLRGITYGNLFTGTDASTSGFALARYSANASPPLIEMFKSRGASVATNTVVQSGDSLGTFIFSGADGTDFIQGASITASVDGTPGTNDMPGRLTFSTTLDGASSPTERMRITNSGAVGIGSTSLTGYSFRVGNPITGSATSFGSAVTGTIQSDVTSAYNFWSSSNTVAASFTLTNLFHFGATQTSIGAGSTITNQYGFSAGSTLTGATNNFGFHSSIASGTGRWNFYAAGTADNYFAGNVGIGTTTPTAALNVVANTNTDAVRITQTGATGNALVVEDASNPDATPFVVDASGVVIQGYTTNLNSAGIQAHSTSQPVSQTWTRWWSGSAGGPQLSIQRSRGASPGTLAVVQNGDALGTINFSGDDGAAFLVGAAIAGVVDGTPGTNDMPGRLAFFTTADGASSITERMRITNAGNVGIGTTSPATDALLTLGGAAGTSQSLFLNGFGGDSDSAITNTNGNIVFSNGAGTTVSALTERMRITNSGAVGIGVTPSAQNTLQIGRSITGSAFSAGAVSSGQVQSDVTSRADYFLSAAAVAAGTYATINGYQAQQSTFTGTVTNQRGFSADASLIGGTNNFGFYGDIPSGTNRWNFYANGTAANYFAGQVQLGAGTVSAPALSAFGDTNTGMFFPAADTIAFAEGGVEAMRLDSAGNVGIGTTSPTLPLTIGPSTLPAGVSLVGQMITSEATGATPILSVRRSAATGNAVIAQYTSSGTASAPTAVAADRGLGRNSWYGFDGTNYIEAAAIIGAVDGTPGTNDMPGRITFAVTLDGASSPTERFRIGNAGQFGIGGANYGTSGQVLVSGGASTAPSWAAVPAPAALSTASGSAPSYSARAFVNYDGTTNVAGNCTIRASGNVSSVADNGTGDQTINFTTAMQDANYTFTATVGRDTSAGNYFASQGTTTPTASALRIQTRNDSGTLQDGPYVCVAIFR